MRFKIDQNLPAEYAALLREAGFEAVTAEDEGRFNLRYRRTPGSARLRVPTEHQIQGLDLS